MRRSALGGKDLRGLEGRERLLVADEYCRVQEWGNPLVEGSIDQAVNKASRPSFPHFAG